MTEINDKPKYAKNKPGETGGGGGKCNTGQL